MSEIINLTKLLLVIANLCNMHFFANTIVCTVLTELLDTSSLEKKIYFRIRKNQQKNTSNETMYKRHSKEITIE